MTATFNSVDGLLGHLDDEDDTVIEASLQSLVDLIPYHWAEIADELTKIEALSEDEEFRHRQLASLLASKIFFHIQSYEDSLNHALCAGDLFNVAESTDYVKKLTEQCIDSYRSFMQTEYRNKQEKQLMLKSKKAKGDDSEDEESDDEEMAEQPVNAEVAQNAIDPRKIKIVEQVFEYCYQTGDFKHAIGIAIECRRLDRVEQAITLSDDKVAMLMHCFNLCETVINSRTFRDELLRLIVKLFETTDDQNYNAICRCYFYLDDTKPISDILWTLINCDATEDANSKKELSAYQIAFDLTEYQNDAFLRGIFNNIPRPPYSQLFPEKMKKGAAADNAASSQQQQQPPAAAGDNDQPADIGMTSLNNDEQKPDAGDDAMVDDEVSSFWDDALLKKWKQLKSILLGETIIPKYLDFLFRNSHSDFLILKNIKDGISERNSVLNNSLICCNAMMHCGTTIDQFLRDNLEWMGRAAHWSKFTATASVGMIHHKHLDESMNILQRYLPGSGGGPYQEGGALYALGLIHIGDNSDITCNDIRSYLLKHLKQASNEILQHGACLGLGLAALGYGTQSGGSYSKDGGARDKEQGDDDEDDDEEEAEEDDDKQTVASSASTAASALQDDFFNVGPSASEILTEIRNILFQDRAVPGEASGLSLGLILCGSGNKQWYEEMLAYAHETQHEKIIRGLVIGISLIFYNLQEQAEYAIQQLITDKLDTIRYGGCYTIGLAYAATANTSAISKLLHLAVSDVSNDVRRAAVTNIGFVLCNKPEQVPKVVQLLSNSYNEHVRYGAAAALGIACAGTGNAAALKILKVLAKDKVDYVRQSSLIALGMLLMQQNNVEQPEMDEIRSKVLQATCVDKREPTMCQMGAILGCGIMDGAGRNVTISLFNKYNNCKRQYSIIGMAIFWQYWYWYPLIPFLTLCFQPTMIMSLNKDLKMLQIDVESREKNKNRFSYVENLKQEKKDKKKKAIKVELSIAAKTKQRQQKKDKEKEKEEKEEEQPDADDVEMADKSAEKEKKEKEKKEKDEMEVDKEDKTKSDDDDKKEKEKEESKYNLLPNPSRVTPNQINFIKWTDKRYKPLTSRLFGFVMVEDTTPDQETQFVEQREIASGGVYGDEPQPPQPFLFLGD